ncbi:MAG: Gfo/Idh/MocA family protein [Anaerolineae bacterium]
MAEYGVGVVGTGWVAGEHIRAWCANPHSRLVGVVSRTRESAQRKLEEVGVGCRIYDTYEQMLADPDIAIVSICTPPDKHVEQAVLAAQAGKHICLEKAIALDLESLQQLRDAVRKAGVKTVVSFVLRWNPMFETIKAQLADNTIGRIFYAESDYYHGIGPWYKQFAWNIKKSVGASSLLSAGIHAVDALRWFIRSEATEVMAISTRSNAKPFDVYEYDPTTVFIAKFADGTVGKCASSIENKSPYVFNVWLLGTEGTIRNNEIWAKEKFPGQRSWVSYPTILPDSGDVTHHPFQLEINHFVDCILNNVESHTNVEDAVKTHELAMAADLSAARGGEIVKLPLLPA